MGRVSPRSAELMRLTRVLTHCFLQERSRRNRRQLQGRRRCVLGPGSLETPVSLRHSRRDTQAPSPSRASSVPSTITTTPTLHPPHSCLHYVSLFLSYTHSRCVATPCRYPSLCNTRAIATSEPPQAPAATSRTSRATRTLPPSTPKGSPRPHRPRPPSPRASSSKAVPRSRTGRRNPAPAPRGRVAHARGEAAGPAASARGSAREEGITPTVAREAG